MAKPQSPPRRKPRFRERNALPQPRATSAVSAVPPPPRVAQPRISRSGLTLPAVRVEHIAYGIVVIAGFVVRIWDVGSRAMHGDEAEHAWFAWHLFNGTGYQYDPVYHGPLQFIGTALFYFLFGVSNTTGRLMAVLFGTALIFLPYYLRQYTGRTAALLSSAYLAFSPAFVYVSRLERDDIFTCFFAFVLVITLFSYKRTGRVRNLYIAAAAVALSLSAMENTYITLFILGLFLLVVLASESLTRMGLENRAFELWRRTGSAYSLSGRALSVALGILALGLAVTVVTGSGFIMPFILAVLILGLVQRQAMYASHDEDEPRLGARLRGVSAQQWLNAATIVVAILFLAYSTLGTNLRGVWDASQPLFNTGNACPGNSYFLNPCRKDILGGLFYWLSQHKVHRGGQPWFYYGFLYGLYEQLAVVSGIGGILWFARKPTLFTSFLTYWAVVSFGIYSWAGEKFPWLMIHPLVPFVLLGSMFTFDLLRQSHAVRLAVLIVLGILALLELHSTYEVNFVNGADPVEMMVYVQSSPDTPKVASNIMAISNKLTNGTDITATIDADDSWPFAWYLRDYPRIAYPVYPSILDKQYTSAPVIIVDDAHQAALYPKLAGHYTGRHYVLRWWFPEDYKSLSWSSFAHDAIQPGYWQVVAQWLIQRRPFGPRQTVGFYYYVKNGAVTPL